MILILRSTVSGASALDADWAAQSAGALWATRFENDAAVYGPSPSEPDSSPTFYQAYCQQNDFVPGPNANITRAAGAGTGGKSCMRMVFPAALAGTHPGSWRRMLVDGQALWPDGTPLYVMYTFKVSAFMLAMSTFDNWKIALIAGYGKTGYGQTNQNSELTSYNQKSHNNIFNWYGGPSSNPIVDSNFLGGSRIRYQNQQDAGSGSDDNRYCLYSSFSSPGCIEMAADTWMSVMTMLTPKSTDVCDIKNWVQFQGSNSWTLLDDYTDYSDWGKQDAPANNRITALTLTLYTTGRNATVAEDMVMDVDNAAVSLSPFPARTVWA